MNPEDLLSRPEASMEEGLRLLNHDAAIEAEQPSLEVHVSIPQAGADGPFRQIKLHRVGMGVAWNRIQRCIDLRPVPPGIRWQMLGKACAFFGEALRTFPQKPKGPIHTAEAKKCQLLLSSLKVVAAEIKLGLTIVAKKDATTIFKQTIETLYRFAVLPGTA